MKSFFRLYLMFFVAVVGVSIFQSLGDGESLSLKEMMQNIQERLALSLLVILGIPALLAGVGLLFQSLISKSPKQ